MPVCKNIARCGITVDKPIDFPRDGLHMSKRVLVVEDNALLGLDMAEQLTNAGLEVVGPAISVAEALKLVVDKGCDVAVLDVNLGSETSEAVALELLARQTPFVTLSGYSSAQHPPGLRGAPALSKPARPEELVAVVFKCLDGV
jgi:DNA-binding response OmpR family regulator